jgi:hypothetical protein
MKSKSATDTALFDRYAQAALTGLLANSAMTTAVSLKNYLDNDESNTARMMVDAAMGYAVLAVKRRYEILHGPKPCPKHDPSAQSHPG